MGALGGSDDVGIFALSEDGNNHGGGLGAAITIGDSNAISVGSGGASNSVGVEALSPGSAFKGATWGGDSVNISGGNQDVITVTGLGAVGVEGSIGGVNPSNTATLGITLGNGGSITVHDTAGNQGVGVLAVNSDTGPGAVNVSLGTTSITVDNGTGIEAIGAGNNTVSATSLGNITAGNIGIEVVSTSGAAFAGYNNTGNASATMNFGGAAGVEAIASGPGNVSATVQIGNCDGQTTIHGTNTGIVSVGVLAVAHGTGAATITSRAAM